MILILHVNPSTYVNQRYEQDTSDQEIKHMRLKINTSENI